MPDQVIVCPNCKKEIPLTEAISHQIKEQLEKEFEAKLKEKSQGLAEKEKLLNDALKRNQEELSRTIELERARLEKEARQKAEETIALELKDLQAQVTEKDRKLAEVENAELEVRKLRRELEEKKKTLELEMDRTLDAEREKIQEEVAKKEKDFSEKLKEKDEEYSLRMKLEVSRLEKQANDKAQQAISLELKDLKEQVNEKDLKLKQAQEAELAFRKQKRDLENRQRDFELEMSRRLDQEKASIREETLKCFGEEHRLKDLEKDKKMNDLVKQLEDLKRRAEQGSQQMQGEVLELELEEVLKSNFPLDHIEPVAKGKRGADILQKVHSQSGQYCGTIIWESKRTKGWNEGWIEKLKDDQRDAKAEIAVLVTTALPKEVSNFAPINGVWVTNYSLTGCLALALRTNLIQVANAKLAAVGKNEKMEVLYNYLSGPEFSQRVEAIAGAFVSMKSDLDHEKRAMNKIWSKREKQIERVINNISGMHGDMQGIIGSSLPQIKSLELKTLLEDDISEDSDSDKEDIPF